MKQGCYSKKQCFDLFLYFIFSFASQSVSPGMVDTEFLTAFDSSFYSGLPRLKPDDVTAAVLYALSTPKYTQVRIVLPFRYHSLGFILQN